MITVKVKKFNSAWAIKKKLGELNKVPMMAFDVETNGLYSRDQRKEALKLLQEDLEGYTHKLASVVANNSGLSFPTLVRTTHFIFGLSEKEAIVMVAHNHHTELLIWQWLADYPGKLLIHNTLFDLKIMYNRVGKIPQDFEDTALMAKTLVNNSDVWKAKTGLKELMAGVYSPFWEVFNDYEPDDLENENFIQYAAIDGAATYNLYSRIMYTAGEKANGE